MADRGRKDSKSKNTVTWKCRKCSKEFKEDDSKILECERCDEHYCTKCVKFTDREYEFLTARPDLHWFCFECDAKVVKGIEQDREIEQRCEVFFGKLNVRMEIFEANMDKKTSCYGFSKRNGARKNKR